MADQEKKLISADDRLRALALFTMANEHAIQTQKFEAALCRLLNLEEPTHAGSLSDLIYRSELQTVSAFDKALKEVGFEVEDAS